jgi:NAD(P)-dependent dehydrogenase (short-subunit alcohol dehydrogenase family)
MVSTVSATLERREIEKTFAERVVVVTGAASGIGRATSMLLAGRGASLVLNDIDARTLGAVTNEIRHHRADVHMVAADVSTAAGAEAVIAVALGQFQRVDVLCNVAGVLDRSLMAHEVDVEVWDRVIAVDLSAPFLLARAALPNMLERGGGVIVNVSSVAGIRGGRAGVAYTAAKHGLIGLTQSIGVAYGPRGIRCVAVCPGATDARTGDVAGEISEFGVAVLDRSREQRPGEATAREIADVIAFAASDNARHINASVIVADGGWTAH